MLKIYLRNGLRSLLRFRSFSLINLIGLTLGLSAIMVLSVMLYQYLTVNGQFRNQDRLYYVKMHTPSGGDFTQTPYPLLYQALASCPEIEAGTHIMRWGGPWLKAGTKEFQDDTWYVDTGFFRVFSFPLEYGDPRTALRNKFNVVLSHEMAEKLFGSTAAAQGKTLLLDDTNPATVTGVLQPVPTNTTIRPQVILTSELLHANTDFAGMANWYNCFAENYLLLRPGADIAKLNAQLNQIGSLKFDPGIAKDKPYLVPYTKFVQQESGNLTQVLIKGEIGTIFFILLIVVANLLNLNAATLMSRQKEMAVRKMMGSRRIHIIVQFVLENAMLVFASLLLAFLLFRTMLMPAINTILRDHFGEIAVNIRHDYPLIGFFVAVGLVIVVLVGAFPAFHFGSLRPVDAIKGRLVRRGERHIVRNIFITLQFVMATIFIGVAIILHGQISHMKTAALGFDQGHVLVANLDLAYRDPKAAAARYDALLNDLRHNPAVESFSTANNIPTGYDWNYNTFYDPVTNRELSIRQGNTDDGMLPTYKVPIIEGRNFDGSNDYTDSASIIINRKAMVQLGWTHAVGKKLRAKGNTSTFTVVGVMEDFHYGDLTRDIGPLMHYFSGKQKLNANYLSIRIHPGHDSAVAASVAQAFRDIPSRRALTYDFMEDRIDKQYSFLEGILSATNFVAMLMVFIAAMGLFGLIAQYTRQRVKEVGIRKVLGAGTGDIVRMLSRNFLFLITIALLIATPVAWWVMHSWLQDFAYRITIQWWMLMGAGLIALAIGAVTIGFHAIRAAKANPVDSLRSE